MTKTAKARTTQTAGQSRYRQSMEMLLGGRASAPSLHSINESWYLHKHSWQSFVDEYSNAFPTVDSQLEAFEEKLLQWRDEHEVVPMAKDQELSRSESFRATVEQVLHFPSPSVMAEFVKQEGTPYLAMAGGRAASLDHIPFNAKSHIPFNDQPEKGVIDPEFNRVRTMEQALALLERGWPEGRERLMQAVQEFQERFTREVQRSTWQYDIIGSEVDVDAYLRGDLEYMLEYRPGQDSARAVSITVDTNVRCSACGRRGHDAEPTAPQWLLFRGLAVAMLIEQLLRAGYRVTLRTVTHTLYLRGSFPFHRRSQPKAPDWESWAPGSGSNIDLLRTVVTDVIAPGDTVDMDAVVVALAHEAPARRFDFLVHEVYNTKPPFAPLTNRNQLHSEPRHAAPSPVGHMPLRVSPYLAMFSALDTRSDIYLPSPAATEDFTMEAQLYSQAMDATQQWAGLYKRLFGPHYATASSSFEDAARASQWTLQALESVGVNFA